MKSPISSCVSSRSKKRALRGEKTGMPLASNRSVNAITSLFRTEWKRKAI